MNILDVIKFDGYREDWLMYKYQGTEFNNKSKLIVSPGQIAILVHNGKVEKICDTGTHQLDSETLPILSRLQKSIYNGKNPFPIEIYFVNKRIKLDFFWGTAEPLDCLDPQYKVKLRLRCRGQLGVKLVEYQYFFEKLVGTVMEDKCITFDIIRNYFRGLMNQKIRKELSSYIIKNKVSYFEISMHIDEITNSIKQGIESEFKAFGFDLLNFSIESIDCPEEDTEKLNEILHKKAEMDQLGGDNYRTIRGYDVLEAGAKNNSGVAPIVGLGLGAQINGQLGAGIIPNEKEGKNTIECPKCGAKISADSRFCPECGTKIISECPKCGAKVSPKQKFCPECGEKLYK